MHLLLVWVLVAVAGFSATACQSTGRGSVPAETERLQRAVAMALEASADERGRRGACRMTGAVERYIDGKYVWVITLKASHLLPEDPSVQPIGLGGEIFVNVDLATGGSELRFGQ